MSRSFGIPGLEGPSRFSARHHEVLRAATVLIAERGLKGASLRELARRLGVRQPSLYTYFDSKDQLVDQIIEAGTEHLFAAPPALEFRCLEDLCRAMAGFCLIIYSDTAYVQFVRFLFAISIERGDWRDQVRERFVMAGRPIMRELAQPLVQAGELLEDDLDHAGLLVVGAVLFELLNERVLLDQPIDHARFGPYIEFIVESVSAGIRARTARRRTEEL